MMSGESKRHMKIEVSHRVTPEGVAIIQVAGRVMLGTESGRIDKVVDNLLAEGNRRFVFDLTDVPHMDSTGIGRFVAALNKVTGAGGAMRMAGATGGVREGFRVTRLDTIFEFYPEVAAALESFARTDPPAPDTAA